MKIRKYLIENSVSTDVEQFKHFLGMHYKEIPDLNLDDIEDVFQLFINNGYWDYLNFDFLSEAISTFTDAALKRAEIEYRDRVSAYMATVKIAEFIILSQEKDKLNQHLTNKQTPSTARKRSESQYHERLSVKINVNVESTTLKFVEDLWKKLSVLDLPKIGVVLDRIVDNKGIWVIWIIFIPSICNKIQQKAKTSDAVEFFKENEIVQAFLNTDCLYIADGEDPMELSRKIVRQSSSIDSIEEEPEEQFYEDQQLKAQRRKVQFGVCCSCSYACGPLRLSQRSYWQLVAVRRLTSLRSEATFNRRSVMSVSEKMMRYTYNLHNTC